ncbi:MAG: phosphotransferase [Bacilli bacterium]
MRIDNNQMLVEKIKQILQIREISSIKFIKLQKNNLANDIYKLKINNKSYILKKYNYNYDFFLMRKLYEIYTNNKIKLIQPINENVIEIDNTKFDIFEYLSNSNGIIDDDLIIDLISIDRKVELEANLISKCDFYYNNLCKSKKFKVKETRCVLYEYSCLRTLKLFDDKYINHGDLSKTNILFNSNIPYIIDFDEAVVTTELYDFAVMMVKLKTNGKYFKCNEIRKIIINLNMKYTLDEYKAAIKMYLCKVLLEKFYLYEIGKIDLFDETQMNDNYLKYFALLNDVSRI